MKFLALYQIFDHYQADVFEKIVELVLWEIKSSNIKCLDVKVIVDTNYNMILCNSVIFDEVNCRIAASGSHNQNGSLLLAISW